MNPATGDRGSIIDARAIDHAQREITNAITRLGLTLEVADLEQLGLAIQLYVQSLTGGGETSAYATRVGLRSTLPILPEVISADSRLAISLPLSGTLFVSAAGRTGRWRHITLSAF